MSLADAIPASSSISIDRPPSEIVVQVEANRVLLWLCVSASLSSSAAKSAKGRAMTMSGVDTFVAESIVSAATAADGDVDCV
eukprot:gene16659-11918_t